MKKRYHTIEVSVLIRHHLLFNQLKVLSLLVYFLVQWPVVWHRLSSSKSFERRKKNLSNNITFYSTTTLQDGNVINQCAPKVKVHEIRLKSKSNYKDDTSLFRNTRFMLDEMTQQNVSIFAMFLFKQPLQFISFFIP